MTSPTNDGTTFVHQCDALTRSGERCKNTNQKVFTHLRAQLQVHDVNLCRRHVAMWERVHHANMGKPASEMKRLPLRDGGYFGGCNRYDYYGMVTADPVIDWDDPGLIVEIPKAWVIQ